MFNRTVYNRQPYNRSVSGVFQTALVQLSLGAAAAAGLQHRQTAGVAISLGAKAVATLRKQAAAEAVSLGLAFFANSKRVRIAEASAMPISLGLKAVYYAYGTEVIDLTGLVLAPGGELVIDTDAMTVTLNGASVIEYVSMDSSFIQLLAGLNTIVYQDASGANRTATIKIEWKPRWL